MVNWLEHARQKLVKTNVHGTTIVTEKIPTAVMAVPCPEESQKLQISNGTIGSTIKGASPNKEAFYESFEERAAIMEFDGGMNRDKAEQQAWISTTAYFFRRQAK